MLQVPTSKEDYGLGILTVRCEHVSGLIPAGISLCFFGVEQRIDTSALAADSDNPSRIKPDGDNPDGVPTESNNSNGITRADGNNSNGVTRADSDNPHGIKEPDGDEPDSI